MKLKELDTDSLIVFYWLLLENEKFTNISSLKRAIIGELHKKTDTEFLRLVRGIK